MFWFGFAAGMAVTFAFLTIASFAGAALVVRVDQHRQDLEPIPKLGPSLLSGLEVNASDEVSAKALRGIERGLADHDRYKQALESISTVDRDPIAQRIARQALGKGWTA